MAEDIPNLRKLQKEPHLMENKVPPADGSEDFVYDSEDHGTIIIRKFEKFRFSIIIWT